MKISTAWLRDWVDHELDGDELARRLTLLGLEVESVTPVGQPLDRVVVGHVLEVRRHPDADRLSICRVELGAGAPVDIVCGAPNVRAGGRYPAALPGAVLPGGAAIRATTIRGQASAGMLCSGREIGLDGQVDGLIALDGDAVPGASVNPLLALGDAVIDINITPNRADCLSIGGIAREVAAHVGRAATMPPLNVVAAKISYRVDCTREGDADCSRFVSRVVRGLRADASTPLWMRERLRRVGLRSINPVVDVTNYVMIETGQPLHAYDLDRLSGGLVARRARVGESLELLNGQSVALDADVLVIADNAGPVGLAGIMGGQRTAVSASTSAICFEAAWFAREVIAGRGRRYGLTTDASMRFERGVDPALQTVAVERATALLTTIAGGDAGPLMDDRAAAHLSMRPAVALRRARLARVLGLAVPDSRVAEVLTRLGMEVKVTPAGWQAVPPTVRFDIEREEDLIEEVARGVGYDDIPVEPGAASSRPVPVAEIPDANGALVASLVARGFQEAITYSFVDPSLSRLFGGAEVAQLDLRNPISSDLATMRQSLWPGLIKAAAANLARQQDRVRLFEIGTRFLDDGRGGHREESAIAFVAAGSSLPEQWGQPARSVDYFDAKADVESLLAQAGLGSTVRFEAARHPALHPGRSARLAHADGTVVGWLGEIHPGVARQCEVRSAVLFEAVLSAFSCRGRPAYAAVSKFPTIRRDLAVVVPRALPVQALLDCIRAAAPATLRRSVVFDIYTGAQVDDAEKSVAIGLILQDTSRTLTVEDADDILGKVIGALGRDLKARIRE